MSVTTGDGTAVLPRHVEISGVIDCVRERAADSERAGRLHDDVVAALRDTGINRLLIPAALGGFEASPRECVEIIEQIAAADGSTAWAAAIGLGTNLFAGYVDQSAAAEIFADIDASNAATFAPLGHAVPGADGQLRLSGRWPFTSNCLHASWIGLGAFFHDRADGAMDPVPRMAFVPRSAVQVDSTWDVNGLRATGSHHTWVDGVVADRAHSCAFGEAAWSDGTLWRIPLFTALMPCLAAVFLGIARAAVDDLSDQARHGRAAMRGALVDQPVDMFDLASADMRLRSARAGLLELLDEAWTLAANDLHIDRCLQARTLLAIHHISEVATEATSTAHRLAGGQAAYNDSRILRALRDVHTARQHMLFARGLATRLAPIATGIDMAAMPFVL